MTVEWEVLLREVEFGECPRALLDFIPLALHSEDLDLLTITFRRLIVEKIVCTHELHWEGLIYSCQMHMSGAWFTPPTAQSAASQLSASGLWHIQVLMAFNHIFLGEGRS